MTARQRAWLLPPAALFLILGILAGRAADSPLLPLLACLPALSALVLSRGWFRFAACMVLCLALGALSGQHAWHPALPAEGDYGVRGIISDTVRRGNFGQVRVYLSDVSLNGRPLSSGAYWTFYLDGEDETLPEGLAPGREVLSIRTATISGRNCSAGELRSACTVWKVLRLLRLLRFPSPEALLHCAAGSRNALLP